MEEKGPTRSIELGKLTISPEDPGPHEECFVSGEYIAQTVSWKELVAIATLVTAFKRRCETQYVCNGCSITICFKTPPAKVKCVQCGEVMRLEGQKEIEYLDLPSPEPKKTRRVRGKVSK